MVFAMPECRGRHQRSSAAVGGRQKISGPRGGVKHLLIAECRTDAFVGGLAACSHMFPNCDHPVKKKAR